MNFDFEILFFKAKWKNVAFCLAVILILKQSLVMVVQYYTLFFRGHSVLCQLWIPSGTIIASQLNVCSF